MCSLSPTGVASGHRHSSFLDSGAHLSGNKAPPTKHLTAADNDRPRDNVPRAPLPWNASEGLHLLDAVTPDSPNPSATPTVQPTNTRSRVDTLAISSLKSNCQEKGVAITPVCAFYFGRAAGSAVGARMGCVNARLHDPQTRCAQQSFPDFLLTWAPDRRMQPTRPMRVPANQRLSPAPYIAAVHKQKRHGPGAWKTRVGRAV
jgi:hypothetical protein